MPWRRTKQLIDKINAGLHRFGVLRNEAKGQVSDYLVKTDFDMTRILPGVLAMATVVVASNILVQFMILDELLTWGAFTYPLAFLVTDVMNRVYGPGPARRVVFIGFIVGVICSLIFPAVALRVAIGSATAFLVAQLIDVAIFQRFRDGAWWKAPLTSTFIGSTIDTALFFTIAFSATLSFGAAADGEVSWAWDAAPFMLTGPDAPLWVTLAVADWGVKIAIALIALIPFRLIVGRMQSAA